MSKIELNIIDPEEQEAKNAEIMAKNIAHSQTRLAIANRAAGHPEPKPGDRLYVQLQRGIRQRSRAGVVFFDDRRVVVMVTDDDSETPPPGVDAMVSRSRAEEILADNALTVGARSASDMDGAAMASRNAELEAQLQQANAELAKLRRARQGAKDSGDGRPARLMAAEAARSEGDSDADGFGGGRKA